MSFQDSAVIFFIALLLFGPKKLPELARQIGKLMGEFRRASNDFRMQMEDELRISEQAERQKQIAAIEAAAPASVADLPAVQTPSEELDPHPHAKLSAPAPVTFVEGVDSGVESSPVAHIPEHTIAARFILKRQIALATSRAQHTRGSLTHRHLGRSVHDAARDWLTYRSYQPGCGAGL